MDELMTKHHCSHGLIVEDLNRHLQQTAYESLLTVQSLADFVTFQTHERDGKLDPFISSMAEGVVNCSQLGPVGGSDHYADLTKVNVGVTREETFTWTM